MPVHGLFQNVQKIHTGIHSAHIGKTGGVQKSGAQIPAVGHTHLIGDVELTEYDFKCPSCNRIINPDEQYVIEKIQKMVGRHILTEEEYFAHEQAARSAIAKKRKTTDIIVKLIAIIGTIIAIYYAAKTGNFSFKFYF